MEKIDRLEQLLKEYSYQSLTTEQREWVAQHISSEEEYESLRRSSLQLDKHLAPSGVQPSPEILISLKQHWRQNRKPVYRNILDWTVPGYAFALALLVVAAASWYAGLSNSQGIQYVDRTVTQHDTLRVASRPDTVLIERVVYRQAPPAAPPLPTRNVSTEMPAQSKGVNMKEKEELEKLLVSGGI